MINENEIFQTLNNLLDPKKNQDVETKMEVVVGDGKWYVDFLDCVPWSYGAEPIWMKMAEGCGETFIEAVANALEDLRK